MKTILAMFVTSFVLGAFRFTHAYGSTKVSQRRDELRSRLQALQAQIDALERAIPNVENKVKDNTNDVEDLQRRKIQSDACTLTQNGNTCVFSTPLLVANTVSVVGPVVRAGSLSVVGDLDVKGNFGVNGTFSHTGTSTSVAGSLNVNLEATINDDMAVIGNFDVTNNAIFWGNLDIVGPDSTTTFLKDLHVKTDTVFSGAATMYGDVIVDGPFNGKPPNQDPGTTYYDLMVKSQYIDIKKKSYWESDVSVKKDKRTYADMKVDDLIIRNSLTCSSSSSCSLSKGHG